MIARYVMCVLAVFDRERPEMWPALDQAARGRTSPVEEVIELATANRSDYDGGTPRCPPCNRVSDRQAQAESQLTSEVHVHHSRFRFRARSRMENLLSALMLIVAFGCLVGMPTPAPAQVKNVLLIVSDDLRANVLGCYGNQLCQTPNIDRLASEGMLFQRTYCQGTVCGPSRTSFMHGRYQGGGNTNVAWHFKNEGWYTARVGKIFHMRVPGDIIAGTDGRDIPESWTERFNSPGQEAHTPGLYACWNLNVVTREPEDRQSTGDPHRPFVSVQSDGDGTEQPDHKTATKIIELLREHKDEPFFLAAGFVRPHYPMVAPPNYFSLYSRDDMQLPSLQEGDLDDIPHLGLAGNRSTTNGIEKYPDNQKEMWSSYFAATTFMDEQVGRILDELDRLGLRESTAIVFTSDHGYHLGDHTFWLKNNLHEQVTRVPLIVSVPGMQPAQSDAIVELVDLYPTLTESTGIATPEDVQGTSLLPMLNDPTTEGKSGALSYARGGHSWRTKRWAYMRYPDGSEELYDMVNDPNQFTNLAMDPGHQEQKEQLARQLDERLQSAGSASEPR